MNQQTITELFQAYRTFFGKGDALYQLFSPYRICPLGAHVDHQHGLVTGFAFNSGINKHTRTLKTRYTLDGERYKDMQRDVHINPTNVNLMATVSWSWIGLYARYTPSSAFDTDYGPKFHSLSVGVMLFGF